MGFRDPFQYRSRADIDKGWPDLHNGSGWKLKKIYKVKTSCLKLMPNIRELFDVRVDTVWLSQLYFQRYYSQNAFQTNTAIVFVVACIHMACKANDQPRPLDKIIQKIFKLRYARDPVELKKIDDMMVFVEFKERVLLAERALLYAFAFDFRTGDPISFAIKYHSACGLDQGASETFLDWLLFAGQATTLCLQYPPSTIAVASLWYTLHLYFGEVPKDSDGMEFWEKLPIEKQDRVSLPAPTAEMIEDMHWQLVPELSTESFRLMLQKHPNGRLPGAGCPCKACLVHQRKVDNAAAASATDPVAAQPGASDEDDTAAAADAVVRRTLPADPAHTLSVEGGQPLATCMQDKKDTGASAPRTGSTPATIKAAAVQHAANVNATAEPSVAPPDFQPGTFHRPASAPLSPAKSASQAANSAAADRLNRGPHASPSDSSGQRPRSHAQSRDKLPLNAGHNAYQQAANEHANGSVPLASSSSHVSSAGLQDHGPSAAPHTEQHGHQQAEADDDNDSLEEGEIEEGEVLPDGSVAGPTSNAHSNIDVHDASANGHVQDTNHESAVTTSVKDRKRSASPDPATANGYHTSYKRVMQT